VGDRTRPTTAGVLELYARTTPVVMEGPKRVVSLATELPFLGTVGFRDIDLHYKNLDYAVFGGRRPSASDFRLVVEEKDDAPKAQR
jgi:hypothetical protein